MSIINTSFPDVAANGATGASYPPVQTEADGSTVNKDTFLKLLIAQIQHQDPLKPTDGTQFLAQLAQFSQLEQLIDIRQQLTTLATAVSTVPAPAPTTAPAPATGGIAGTPSGGSTDSTNTNSGV